MAIEKRVRIIRKADFAIFRMQPDERCPLTLGLRSSYVLPLMQNSGPINLKSGPEIYSCVFHMRFFICNYFEVENVDVTISIMIVHLLQFEYSTCRVQGHSYRTYS